MNNKAVIRKQPNGKWLATRPTYGLATQPEQREAATQQEALRWLQHCTGHGGSARDDNAYQDHDGISATPKWSTLERTTW